LNIQSLNGNEIASALKAAKPPTYLTCAHAWIDKQGKSRLMSDIYSLDKQNKKSDAISDKSKQSCDNTFTESSLTLIMFIDELLTTPWMQE